MATRTRAQEREYRRRYRVRKRAEAARPALQVVPPLVPDPASEPGETEIAVRKDMAELNQPDSQVMAGVALARILDDREAQPQHPAAAKALSDLMFRWQKQAPARGRLALMRAARDTDTQ